MTTLPRNQRSLLSIWSSLGLEFPDHAFVEEESASPIFSAAGKTKKKEEKITREEFDVGRDGDVAGRSRGPDPDVGGADGVVEAHRGELPVGERGLPQVQAEGPQPGEVPREGPASHPLRAPPVSTERSSPEVHKRDGCLCWLHVLPHKRVRFMPQRATSL
ncbi:uncharacterized protein LOC104425507 isoform X1 [Eucalyptus grandis]|uniref:uncharacterized protein LOC104425507 isoform X1 n=1 Tax=Eucalyptus grandis TaxID=71139 RepID=UPI00192E8A7A|nr:uncharacterized protein LOC104425507 isoform X1 [Eucalyptus grandis]